MKDIAEWLASIGLSQYAQRFADNAIDLSVMRDLTEQDLKDLGVLLGHRRKILRAIAELDGLAPAPTETANEQVLRRDAERRHLTVMICDLVGSTALSNAARSGGHARRGRCLSRRLCPYHANL
jgi:class 3 adenylate cyclase